MDRTTVKQLARQREALLGSELACRLVSKKDNKRAALKVDWKDISMA